MTFFCALLTGFFLWLFLFHWHYAALARARAMAGAPLLDVTPVVGSAGTAFPWRARSIYIIIALSVFAWLADVLLPSCRADVIITCITAGFLELAFPPVWKKAPLELRERGVVRRNQSHESPPGTIVFTPWEELAGCKWCEKQPDRYYHARFLLLGQGDLSVEQTEAITVAVGRCVPVFDIDGKLLAEPDAAVRSHDALLPPQGGGRLRFQFSLQSLMLLTIVVSCAASCYGVHYRRALPQRKAVVQLSKFKPLVYVSGDNVWLVNFSACAVKPSDDDLVQLARLPNLDDLNLDGAPITDAGLKHLYSLKKLTRIDLSNTKITRQGLDDLEKTLPNARVLCYPRPPAMTPVGTK